MRLFRSIGKRLMSEGLWKKREMERRYRRDIKRWATTKKADLRDVYRGILEHVIPIRLPVVLISQIPRSGGTLLLQLFDGHPECHVNPYDSYIGYPNKNVWPMLDLKDKPERWFEILFEPPASRAFREGFKKISKLSTGVQHGNYDVFPFIFLPSLQREIFLRCITTSKNCSLRDVFDAYMTSYFNAWLNNQNLYGQKKIAVVFAPRMAMFEENVDAFFNVYPDGKLLSIIRDPQSWYVSAREHNKNEFGDIQKAMLLWKTSAQAMVRNKKQYGDRVRIIKFQDLIFQTEFVMRSLANYVGIAFDTALLTPSFNRLPIRANSSFSVESYGVLLGPVLSRKEMLDESEINITDRTARETYEDVLSYSS